MLAGLDDDSARDCIRTINRLRSILTQISPSLEQVLAVSTLTRTPVLDTLIHYKGPQGLNQTGHKRVLNLLSKRTRKDPTELVDALFDALQAHTVIVPGTEAAQLVIFPSWRQISRQ